MRCAYLPNAGPDTRDYKKKYIYIYIACQWSLSQTIFFNVSNENVQGLNGSPTMYKKKKSVIEEKFFIINRGEITSTYYRLY